MSNATLTTVIDGIQLPPGRKGSKMREAMNLVSNPYAYLKGCRAEFGDTFTLSLPGTEPMIWSADPDIIKASFKLKGDEIDATRIQVPFDVGEDSITFINDKPHQQARRLVFPAVHNAGLNSFNDMMLDALQERMQQWKAGNDINLMAEMEYITLGVIIRCVFGAQDNATIDELRNLVMQWSKCAISPMIALSGNLIGPYRQRMFLNRTSLDSYYNKKFNRPWRQLVPWLRVCDARARLLDRLMQGVLQAREAQDEQRGDLLNMYALTKTDDGEYLSEEYVLSELLSMLVAGHETTTITVSWFFANALNDHRVIDKIREEIRCVFPEGNIDPARIDELQYLADAIDESQRLSPIAIGIPRCIAKPVQIGELQLPANVTFLPCLYLVHHDPRIWGNDVEEFRPERMQERKINLHEFLPFGGGRRRCIGAAFAQRQMRIQLAEILAHCEFVLPEDFETTPVQAGQAVTIKEGISASLETKSASFL
jgi:cytochrome P450